MWRLAFILLLIGQPAFAVDPQFVSEIDRLREVFWELVVSPQWQLAHPSNVVPNNQREMEAVRSTVQVLQRVFGDVDVLKHLGRLPSRSRNDQVAAIEQRRALKAQFDRLDVFLRERDKPYDPSWRTTPIGQEIVGLSVSLMNIQRQDRGVMGIHRLLERKWEPEALTLARLAPYAGLDALLTAGCDHFRGPHGVIDERHLIQAVTDVLLMLRKIEAQLDRGWAACGTQLDVKLFQIEFRR